MSVTIIKVEFFFSGGLLLIRDGLYALEVLGCG